jgi:hypothetical protein
MLTATGTLAYYKRLDTTGYDFKKQVLRDGTVRHTYVTNGLVHVMDDRFREIGTQMLLAYESHEAYNPDLHDLRLIDDAHFVLLAYVRKTVTNVPAELPHPAEGATVVAAVVQEIQNGTVLFDWDSTEHPELYALSTDGNHFDDPSTPADYVHVNSVDVDPTTGNLVISCRHLDAILELSRGDGSIAWRLGNNADTFGTTSGQKTSHQHYARFQPDGTILAFDNGNASGATRAVQFRLDTANRTVTSFVAYPFGEFSSAMGSVQWVGTSLFAGFGAHVREDAHSEDADVVEFDPVTGQRSFALRFNGQYYSYRAQKFE